METTNALLLRTTKLTETSLIVTWFTQDFGLLKTVAKGARQQKSRFFGSLDLFHHCEVQFARSRRSELHVLREVMVLDAHWNLRPHYDRIALASYFVELLELVTEPDHPMPELYDLLLRALRFLDAHPASHRPMLHFEQELARLLGIRNAQVTPAVAIGRVYHRLPGDRAALLKRLPEREA